MKTTTNYLPLLSKSLKVICKVLLSNIQKKLLYEEAINKEAFVITLKYI
jgi:hypothetical protein